LDVKAVNQSLSVVSGLTHICCCAAWRLVCIGVEVEL